MTISTRRRSSTGFARLAVDGWSNACGSRCSTRSSTAATTTCPRRTSGRGRGGCRPPATVRGREVMGWPRGRLPDARSTRSSGASAPSAATCTPAPRSTRSSAGRAAPPVSSWTAASFRSTSSSARSLRRRRGACSRPTWRPVPPTTAAATSASSASSLRVCRSVSPYYHLNITDRRVPLTTIVETTHVVDPER